jgi:galactose-1-phosphate uridylyltransferase
MNTLNFQNLIRLVTGRDFIIKTNDADLQFETEYKIYRVLPISKDHISFFWKTPKSDEKMLRSFITAFTSKYREPNPESYNYVYGGKVYTWDGMTELEKEGCRYHHVTHMYSKEMLLKQVEDIFQKMELPPVY